MMSKTMLATPLVWGSPSSLLPANELSFPNRSGDVLAGLTDPRYCERAHCVYQHVPGKGQCRGCFNWGIAPSTQTREG